MLLLLFSEEGSKEAIKRARKVAQLARRCSDEFNEDVNISLRVGFREYPSILRLSIFILSRIIYHKNEYKTLSKLGSLVVNKGSENYRFIFKRQI